MNDNISDFTKLICHFNSLKVLQTSKDSLPCPVSIVMDTTNKICPQNCWYCYITQYSPDRPLFDSNKELPFDRACEVVSEMAEAGVKAIEFCGAEEPLSYSKVYPLIEHILNSGIEFGLITNGTNLDKDLAFLLGTRAKWVRISFDAIDETVYNNIRRPRDTNAGFQVVKENIERLGRIKKEQISDTELGISTVLEPRNLDQIYELAKFSKSCGMSYHRFCTVTFPSVNNIFKNKNWVNVEKQISRIKLDLVDDHFFIFEPTNPNSPQMHKSNIRDYKRCYFSLLTMVIDCELRAYPCAETKWKPEFIIGDLKNESFKSVINSHARLESTKNVELHPHCCRDKANEFLENVLENIPSDLNFLTRHTSTATLKKGL